VPYLVGAVLRAETAGVPGSAPGRGQRFIAPVRCYFWVLGRRQKMCGS
jgi:hypothetical protein